ncbi:hypothetical protein Q5P01_014539 [Channa striata]|uniref:Uncharacterized protein n=1 Tax=Channa striata TaxID=64152 RepID=A0AA88MK00_CHASR|nr:hypothetical protein Q5P01_014539 [Channa striata]
MHTLALEVCETDLLSAGGLGPLHHFLQTENRGSNQLEPGWDNNEPSSHHHHLISAGCLVLSGSGVIRSKRCERRRATAAARGPNPESTRRQRVSLISETHKLT